MKLAILQTTVPHYRIGFLDLLCEKLTAQNHQLHVYSGDNYFTPEVIDATQGKAWRSKVDNSFIFSRKLLWQHLPWQDLLSADYLASELNPRIISTWILCLTRILMRKNYIFWGQAWPRKGSNSKTKIIRLLMWRCCTQRVAYTEREATQLTRLGLPAGAARNALYSINHVNLGRTVNNEVYQLVIIGRLGREKKTHLAIEAVNILTKRGLKVQLHVIGEGPERKSLENLILTLGLQKIVLMHGFIEEHRLPEIMRDALVAISSGFVGLSAMQSFFYGVPLLVADAEPHSSEIEACIEGFNSFFFRSDSATSLADLVEQCVSNKDDIVSRSTEIIKDAKRRYSTDTMAATFASLCSVNNNNNSII